MALTAAEASRFGQAWTALQGRFADNPKGVVPQSDQVVRELVLARGYRRGKADTEERRKAVVRYLALFDELPAGRR